MKVVVIYRWPDGRDEVRYERDADDPDAMKLCREVEACQDRCENLEQECPYRVEFME